MSSDDHIRIPSEPSLSHHSCCTNSYHSSNFCCPSSLQ